MALHMLGGVDGNSNINFTGLYFWLMQAWRTLYCSLGIGTGVGMVWAGTDPEEEGGRFSGTERGSD